MKKEKKKKDEDEGEEEETSGSMDHSLLVPHCDVITCDDDVISM